MSFEEWFGEYITKNKRFPSDLETWQASAREQAELVSELRDALGNMIGWAKYAEHCDPFYFSPEQAPEWQTDLEKANAIWGKVGESFSREAGTQEKK